MENCPAKKVVAGKASEGEVGEKAGWGWGGGRNGENHGRGSRRKDGEGDSGCMGRMGLGLETERETCPYLHASRRD